MNNQSSVIAFADCSIKMQNSAKYENWGIERCALLNYTENRITMIDCACIILQICFDDLDLIIPSQQRWRGYSNAAVRGWLGEWVREWVRACVREWVRNALPCGHDSDYSFCPITFKLHMHICHDERRNPIDFGSRGQRSRSTLARSTFALCI